MNGITENDLSYQKTTLDFKAMKTTAAIATRELREKVNKLNSQLLDDIMAGDITGIHLKAQWLSEYANSLAITADTYATLLGAEEREHVEVINMPEVKEE